MFQWCWGWDHTFRWWTWKRTSSYQEASHRELTFLAQLLLRRSGNRFLCHRYLLSSWEHWRQSHRCRSCNKNNSRSWCCRRCYCGRGNNNKWLCGSRRWWRWWWWSSWSGSNLTVPSPTLQSSFLKPKEWTGKLVWLRTHELLIIVVPRIIPIRTDRPVGWIWHWKVALLFVRVWYEFHWRLNSK